MPSDGFHDFVKELFAGVGSITIKRMFGGAGGYADGLMFLLLVSNDTICLKADEALKAELRKEGSGPFIWAPSSGPRAGENVEMGYWRLPEAAMDDPDIACAWGRKALAVAKAAAGKPKRKAKTKR